MILPSLYLKGIGLLAIVSVLSFGAKKIYDFGYNQADAKMQILVAERDRTIAQQKMLIAELELQEVVIEKEVVTVYKDRVKTITKVKTEIVEVIRDVLGPEIERCTIGPGFISLHNAAAQGIAPTSTKNKGIPGSTKGVDDSSTSTGIAGP